MMYSFDACDFEVQRGSPNGARRVAVALLVVPKLVKKLHFVTDDQWRCNSLGITGHSS